MSDDDPYLVPGTRVLRNKLGITDADALDRAERRLVIQRAREGAPKGDFDLDHLKGIHGHLFQDVYDWAGKVRTGDIGKAGSQFQPLRFLEAGMADVHNRIRRADYLRGLDVEGFAAKAGKIIGDVNYVHPFREGNGRTQLEYLRQLAEGAGHPLDPGRFDRDRWVAASIASHSGDYGSMTTMINEQVVLERNQGQSGPEKPRAVLSVRFADHEAAIAAGARWDRVSRSWSADADNAAIARWVPDRDQQRAEQLIAGDRNALAQMRVLEAVTAKALPDDPDAARRALTAGRNELAALVEAGKPIPAPDLKSLEPKVVDKAPPPPGRSDPEMGR